MACVEILVVIPMHELLVKQLGCLSCEPGRQDFGQISGIICSILPKDPNQEPCSPVRKVSEIQPCPFRIFFFGERPRVYVTYPGAIELKTELKQCCKTCEHDSGTTINAKMIWSMLESKEKVFDDGQITWISQLQPEFSSHFKEIIPSSNSLCFGRYSKFGSRKSWTKNYLVVISTGQITYNS